MRILPFRRPSVQAAPLAERDWSQQELADFYRAHRLLAQNGVAIGLDRGQTEDGDPWMVFFDTATQDVFLHVARFDDKVVLICDTLQINLSRRSVADIVVAFEGEVRQMLTVRQERATNVLLHPAARIIMSISAVFLLFKLENGGTAQAKTIATDATLLDASRKQDMSVAARVHQAIGRLLDLADTPAAAAAIAGAILTIELTRNHLGADAHQALPMVEAEHHASEATVAVADLNAVTQAETGHPEGDAQAASQQSAAPHIAVEVAAVDLDARVEIALKVKAPPVAQPAETQQPQHDQTPTNDAQGDTALETIHRAPGNTTNGSVSSAPTPVDTTTPVAPAAVETASLASQAVETLLGASTVGNSSKPLTAAISASFVEASGQAASSTILVAAPPVGEVTAANIDMLDSIVSVFRETALSGDRLTDTIIDFMGRLGTYDVEITGTKVLIEQHDTASLSGDVLGIWTNVMSDGSEISVIGHANIFADAAVSALV